MNLGALQTNTSGHAGNTTHSSSSDPTTQSEMQDIMRRAGLLDLFKPNDTPSQNFMALLHRLQGASLPIDGIVTVRKLDLFFGDSYLQKIAIVPKNIQCDECTLTSPGVILFFNGTVILPYEPHHEDHEFFSLLGAVAISIGPMAKVIGGSYVNRNGCNECFRAHIPPLLNLKTNYLGDRNTIGSLHESLFNQPLPLEGIQCILDRNITTLIFDRRLSVVISYREHMHPYHGTSYYLNIEEHIGELDPAGTYLSMRTLEAGANTTFDLENRAIAPLRRQLETGPQAQADIYSILRNFDDIPHYQIPRSHLELWPSIGLLQISPLMNRRDMNGTRYAEWSDSINYRRYFSNNQESPQQTPQNQPHNDTFIPYTFTQLHLEERATQRLEVYKKTILPNFIDATPDAATIQGIHSFIKNESHFQQLISEDGLVLGNTRIYIAYNKDTKRAHDLILMEDFDPNDPNQEWCLLSQGENTFNLVTATSILSLIKSGSLHLYRRDPIHPENNQLKETDIVRGKALWALFTTHTTHTKPIEKKEKEGCFVM